MLAGSGAALALGLGGAGRAAGQGPTGDATEGGGGAPGNPTSGTGTKTSYVLVHGGWHGGWCWRDVAARLRGAGHEVWAPTLSGLGERAHQLTPEIDLALHVQDVVGVLEYEDVRDAVLVGHSYRRRVNGRPFLLRCRGQGGPTAYPAAHEPQPPPGRLPRPPRSWSSARPEPLRRGRGGAAAPWPLSASEAPAHPRAPLAPSFAPFAARLRGAPGWRSRELATGHDAMVTVPGPLAALLLELA